MEDMSMRLNIKALAIISLLLVAASMTVVFAQDATVGTSTFEVPDGYNVNGTFDKMALLTDGKSVIIVVEGAGNVSTGKQNLESKGYSLIGENTYAFDDKSGITIHQQNYNKDQYNSCLYIFKKNNKDYVITYTLPEGTSIPSNEDNPVTTIIDTLE